MKFARTAMVGIVALGGIAFVSGCQMSGSTDRTDRTSDSGVARGDAMAATGRFDQTYEATRDTEWVSSTAADAERGTLMRGDRVMLDRAPGTADWQEARTTSGRTVYIRPSDFRRAS
jgi:hypothetical protein